MVENCGHVASTEFDHFLFPNQKKINEKPLTRNLYLENLPQDWKIWKTKVIVRINDCFEK